MRRCRRGGAPSAAASPMASPRRPSPRRCAAQWSPRSPSCSPPCCGPWPRAASTPREQLAEVLASTPEIAERGSQSSSGPGPPTQPPRPRPAPPVHQPPSLLPPSTRSRSSSGCSQADVAAAVAKLPSRQSAAAQRKRRGSAAQALCASEGRVEGVLRAVAALTALRRVGGPAADRPGVASGRGAGLLGAGGLRKSVAGGLSEWRPHRDELGVAAGIHRQQLHLPRPVRPRHPLERESVHSGQDRQQRQRPPSIRRAAVPGVAGRCRLREIRWRS